MGRYQRVACLGRGTTGKVWKVCRPARDKAGEKGPACSPPEDSSGRIRPPCPFQQGGPGRRLSASASGHDSPVPAPLPPRHGSAMLSQVRDRETGDMLAMKVMDKENIARQRPRRPKRAVGAALCYRSDQKRWATGQGRSVDQRLQATLSPIPRLCPTSPVPSTAGEPVPITGTSAIIVQAAGMKACFR